MRLGAAAAKALACCAALAAWVATAGAMTATAAHAAVTTLELRPCWLRGWAQEARCGKLMRPLDPTAPDGRKIELHVAIVPALAQRPASDPVFFFAGGPGQSAIELSGMLARRFARLANRRDLVFIDQRGTGRSAPLRCAEDDEAAAWKPLPDLSQRIAGLDACRRQLERTPHGDLRQYTTTIASLDVDAVRQALGAERINAIGFSYGTRAALDYQRQFPQRLRRSVLDGVAPPDQRLPLSATIDRQAALDALFDDCARQAACVQRFPELRRQWQALLARLPQVIPIEQPLSGRTQALTVTRELVHAWVGAPLYAPALAAGLPQAIAEASAGRWQPMLGLAAALGGAGAVASGMHFSVVCAEDFASAAPPPAPPAVPGPQAPEPAAEGEIDGLYRKVCARWPKGAVPAGFDALPLARGPVLLLSGTADPVTPPRHAERVARALGPKARHHALAEVGHGVLALACAREAAAAFVMATDDDEALRVEFRCPQALPRPPFFAPPEAPV